MTLITVSSSAYVVAVAAGTRVNLYRRKKQLDLSRPVSVLTNPTTGNLSTCVNVASPLANTTFKVTFYHFSSAVKEELTSLDQHNSPISRHKKRNHHVSLLNSWGVP